MSSNLLNKIYKIKAKCLTPLVIQTGREIMPWEYVIFEENGEKILHRFDVFRFYDEILSDKNDKEELKKKLENLNILEIRNWIYEKCKEHRDKIESILQYSEKVNDVFFNKYKENIEKPDKKNEINQLAIKEFMRSRGRAFVPGSSIKGAIRTAVLWNLIPSLKEYVEDIEGINLSNPREVRKIRKIKEDEFKNLLIGDSDFIENNNLKVEIFKRTGTFEKGAFQSMEYLPAGTMFIFQLTERKRSPNKDNKIDFCYGNIVNWANKFLEDKIRKYFENLETFRNFAEQEGDTGKLEQIEKIEKCLQRIQKEKKEREFLLKLGFGGEFWYKSFFEKHPNWNGIRSYKDKSLQIPRTWWHNIKEFQFGFIKCKIINKK